MRRRAPKKHDFFVYFNENRHTTFVPKYYTERLAIGEGGAVVVSHRSPRSPQISCTPSAKNPCSSAAPMIGKHPAGICVPQCDLWAKKVPHGPFRIPHLTLHVIDHPLPAKECRSAAPMARSVLLASSPHGICVPQCDLWAYKTPAWPHSAFNRSSSDGPFHVQHSTFNIPHSTL